GDLWSLSADEQGRSGLRIALRGAEAPEPLHLVDSDTAERDSRPEFYDFDLFGHIGNAPQFEDRPLDELVYTVFDTETTGLDTSSDQIISIGGLRVVNGRPLQNEVFEQLIDPGKPISRESIAVHGISEDMVRGKPDLTVVLPEFHRFAEDTVLVGHNVAFDMSILQRVQGEAGVSFDAPVLDTLLLSAVVYPERGEHSLEKIAERFGIPVVGRHTAVGDAIVTAQVFLHLVKLLQDQGINTLGEALKAAQQTYLARVKY
ncbi:MAG: PolC-type DNA polymerase III, partial [Gammaproteobacteria bacterium]